MYRYNDIQKKKDSEKEIFTLRSSHDLILFELVKNRTHGSSSLTICIINNSFKGWKLKQFMKAFKMFIKVSI